MKIQTKIVLIVFSLVLVVGVVATMVSQTVSKNIVKHQIYNHLETTAQSRAHHIETFLETEREVIKQLSESIVIERFLSANKGDRDYIQKFNDVMRRLEHTARVREYDHGLFVLDKSGTIVASSEETDIRKDKSGDPYFLDGKQGAFIKDAYISQDRKINTLAFSAPIFDEGNIVLLGIVVARVSMEELNRITTDRSGLGETGEIYLVNKHGYMITPSRFVKDTFLKRKVDTENARNCFRDVGRFGAEEHEHEAVLSKNYLDTDVLGVHAHIPKMEWCLLVEMDEKEALAPIARITHTMLSILALLSILGGILSILISRTITKPIVKLHEGTEEIEKGNLDHKVGTKAKDEIGQLSRAFDSMTANLKKSKEKLEEYSRGLEKKVEERTRQFDEKVKESEKQRVATFNLLQDVNQAKNELEKTKEELEVYSTKLVEVNESLKAEITERKRAEKIQSMLFRISQAASGSSNLEELLEIVHQQLGTLIDTTNFYVALYNPEKDLYSFPYCVDQYDKAQNHTHQQLRKSLTDYVRRTGVPLLADEDIHQQLIQKGEVELVGTPSPLWLGAPLKTADGVIGVVVVQSYTDSSCYSATDLELMTFVSENIASVIERKRAEEKVKEQNEFLNNIIESLAHPFYVIDANDYTIKMANSATGLGNLSKDSTCYSLTHKRSKPCESTEHLCPLEEIKKTKKPVIVEHVHYDKNGNARNVEVHGYPIFDNDGNVVQMIEYCLDITERKRAEESVRESESKYRTLVENIPQKIFIKNKNSVYISCNENYAKDLKIKPEEIAGKTDYDFYPKDLAEKYRGDDKRIMELGTTEDIEERYIQDGQELWVHTVKTPVKDENGKVIGILGIFWDITEHKRAEEALCKSQSSLAEAQRIAHLGNWDWDIEKEELLWSDEIYRIFGLAPQESDATYEAFLNSVHPDDREFVKKSVNESLYMGKPYSIDHRIVLPGGSERIVHEEANVFFDETGKPIRMIGTVQDITERKRAEEALRESEERYRDLFENANDLIQSVDSSGKFIYVNKKWKEVIGYSDEEIKKLNLADILRKDQVPHCMKLFKKVMDGETLDNVEAVFVTKEGKEIFVSGAINSRMKDGKFVATRGIFRDITQRKRAEENLRKAKEEAEEANRLKSEFLANMSHEIRTPMNAIIGMSGIALETDLNDEQREYLSIVKESSYALLGLIDDILDLSKIEAGRIELETIDFDLHALVEGVADTLAPRALVKGLELACLIHNQVPFLLRGDPGRLRQILMNLGGNATKFTEKGEVVIRVELEEETEDSATLQFSVTDTGIGILKDKQTKIFESFTQADGSTTRKYGGTGLGLSISRRLVELMGGKIGVDSQPGKGSRFWFTATLEKQKEFKDIPPASVPADIRGKRVMVVDDNKTNRTILVKMLESFGCSAEAVESGDEAIKILKRAVHKEKLFDLVLLDMQMPEMNGEETLRIFKDDPEIKDVAVVMLTSVGVRGDASRLETLGCAAYLLKPIKQSQLFDTIITVLSRQKAGAKEKPVPIVTRHTIAEQKRQRVRILIAEDNPMNQKLAVTLLKRAGYSVDAVENGRKAIEALNRTSYDLILMDVQMPEMDGFEATKAIRQMEGVRKHTPIVAMTAHAMKGDRERCLQAGMDGYVSKPIEPQELFGAIEKWTKSSDRKKFIPPDDKSEKDAHLKDVPVDIESALNRFDGDKEFFKEMLKEFLNSVPKHLQILDEAVNKSAAKVVEKEAHSLKGAAGNLSAKSIADLALKLELLARTGNLAGAKEMICNLRIEFKHLDEYIQRSLPQEVALKS